MAQIIPDPKKIKSFPTQAAFAKWLRSNHARETELWLKIHKKDSGRPTVTYAQALDVALCWGWIDGIRKGFDECSFLQRFTARKARSIWSQITLLPRLPFRLTLREPIPRRSALPLSRF